VQLKCHNVLIWNPLTFDVFCKFIWRQTFVSVEHELLQIKYVCTDCHFCLPSSRPKTTLHQWSRELKIIWNSYHLQSHVSENEISRFTNWASRCIFTEPNCFLFNSQNLQTHSTLVVPIIQKYNHHNLIQWVNIRT
jgi:hypothetical protein